MLAEGEGGGESCFLPLRWQGGGGEERGGEGRGGEGEGEGRGELPCDLKSCFSKRILYRIWGRTRSPSTEPQGLGELITDLSLGISRI